MQQLTGLTSLLLALLFIAACEDATQTTAPVTPAEVQANSSPIDTTRFISADNLLQRMQSGAGHFVFDVRAEASYAESHIKDSLSMPYGKIGPDDVAALAQMSLDTPIVTYCGCPHALAGLAADQLVEWGYRNVRVLHEGYWYWRDNQYPIAGTQAQIVTELQLAGVIPNNGGVGESIEVFIRNSRNGQLEVAMTDSEGRFETAFHVLDLQADDRFEIRLGSIDAPVIEYLALMGNTGRFVVEVNPGS